MPMTKDFWEKGQHINGMSISLRTKMIRCNGIDTAGLPIFYHIAHAFVGLDLVHKQVL